MGFGHFDVSSPDILPAAFILHNRGRSNQRMALQSHHHRNASQIESFLHPKPAPKPTRDFVADNKRLVAEMEEIALARRAELESETSGRRRSIPAAYAHVESRLKAAGATAAPDVDIAAAPRSARKSTAAPAAAIPSRFVRKEVVAPKPSVPGAKALAPAVSSIVCGTFLNRRSHLPPFVGSPRVQGLRCLESVICSSRGIQTQPGQVRRLAKTPRRRCDRL